MYYFILTFLFGCLSVLYFSHVPNLILLFVVALISIALFIFYRFKFFLLLLGGSLGVLWVMFFASWHLHQQLPKSLEGKNLSVIGKVVSIPEKNSHGYSFNFKTTRFNHKHWSRHIKLSWYDYKTVLYAGQKWALTVRLKRPHGFMNSGGFDYEGWLFEKNISATGYVVNKMPNHLIASDHSYFSILRLREKIQEKVLSAFQNDSLAGFLPALLVGSRQAITQQQWDILRNTGTNHLIAIAGLHIGLVSAFVFILIVYFWRRSYRLTLIYPAKQIALFFSAFIAFIYALLAGFPIQTQRAIIMLFVLLLMSFLKRKILDWHSWFLALFLVLLFNPLNVITTGFWMSFIAVASIIIAMRGRIRVGGLWWQWGRVQAVIMIGLLPISFLIYHEASSVSLIANMIAVPWFAFIIMPFILLALFFMFVSWHIAYCFLWFVLYNLHFLWMILSFLSSHPFSVLKPVNISLFALCFAAIGGLLLLAPRGFFGRKLSLLFFLPLFFLPMKRPAEGNFWFTLLDVGQGLSAVIETKNHLLVYDTGPKFSDHFNAGDAVILPYLSVKGLRKINVLMVSHGDNDHIGGSFSLIKNIHVDKILSSVPKRFDKKAAYCHAGQHWQWEGVNFDVLWPPKGDYFEDNNSSCVLRVSNGVQSVLLTGDIEKPVEKKLVEAYSDKLNLLPRGLPRVPYAMGILKGSRRMLPLSRRPREFTSRRRNIIRVKIPRGLPRGFLLKSTILIAPHHGSKSSSSQKFIRAVKPKYVLYGVGYRNRFHFPNKAIQHRYHSLGVKQVDTVRAGAIEFEFQRNSKNSFPISYRAINQHLWDR